MRNKKINLYILVILVIGVIFLSIGFATFTTNLSITSSTSINPNDKDFKVVFSSSSSKQLEGEIIGVPSSSEINESSITINNTNNLKITGLNAGFYEPGQNIKYTLYVHNMGKYNAYLNSIIYQNYNETNNNKVCIPLNGTTKSLVDEACNHIKVKFTIDNSTFDDNTDIIDNIELAVKQYKKLVIEVEYEESNVKVDGDFIVKFGDIILNYGSTD